MCLAIRAAYKIHQDLQSKTFTPPNPDVELNTTTADWVKWTTNPKDPNYPDHENLHKIHKEVLVGDH